MSKLKAKKDKRNLKLFTNTLRFYKQNFWSFTKIAAIVVLISAIIKSYDLTHTNSSDIALILYVAGLYTFLALLWLNFNKKEGEKIKISEIYTSSSARFFPFLAVSLVQSLISLPLIIGFVLIILTVGLGMAPVFILIGGVLIIVSVILLIWYSLAGLVVVEEANLTSIKALSRSKKLVKGNFFGLLFDYLLFILVIGFFSGLIINLITRIGFIGDNWFFKGLIDGVLLTVVLSIVSIFGFNIYQDLKSRSNDQRPSQKKN